MERDLREFLDKIDAAEAENLESVYLYDKAYDEGFADGYKQAVEEFAEKMETWNENIKSIRKEDAFFTIENIREIAEQIKKGGVE